MLYFISACMHGAIIVYQDHDTVLPLGHTKYLLA